jgi:hypothetical protein
MTQNVTHVRRLALECSWHVIKRQQSVAELLSVRSLVKHVACHAKRSPLVLNKMLEVTGGRKTFNDLWC